MPRAPPFLDPGARSFFKNPENQKRLDEFEASAKGSGHDYRVGCLVTDWLCNRDCNSEPALTIIAEFDYWGILGESRQYIKY